MKSNSTRLQLAYFVLLAGLCKVCPLVLAHATCCHSMLTYSIQLSISFVKKKKKKKKKSRQCQDQRKIKAKPIKKSRSKFRPTSAYCPNVCRHGFCLARSNQRNPALLKRISKCVKLHSFVTQRVRWCLQILNPPVTWFQLTHSLSNHASNSTQSISMPMQLF